MMLYLTGRQLLRPIMKRSSCNIATDFTVMSPTFKCSYHRFHYSPRRFSYIKRTKSRKRTFTTPSNKYSTKASTSANKPNIPSLLIGTGLVCGGLAALTEKSWRNPIQINSVTRLEEPILEFQHPYNKKPLWWRIWFATKRLGYLIVLWIPCSTVALAAWLTGDGSVRAKWLRLMVQTIEWAGCSFQKFGQWLSMRPDLLPPDIIEALSELRDNTAEHDMEHNRAMFRTSFGYELDDFFDFFDPKPIASASVGQVHRARLKQKYAMEDGSLEVAVKVRHPRVLDETWIDTTMIFAFMDNSGGLLTMPFSLKDFTFMLQKQFDFEWEAYNMSKFAENFSKETSSSQLRFPSVSGDILSPCVLVESWGKGSSVDNMFSSVGQNWEVRDGNDNSKDMKIKKELATVIFDMNMKMFMRDNFIHGDLHAGNLLYDRDSGALTVLDAGLISQIPPAMNANFVLFIQGMCGGDANAITDQLLVFDNRNSIPGLVNEEVQIQRSELLQTVQQACDHWVDPKTGMAPDGTPISVGDLMGEIMFGLQKHSMLMNGAIASTLLTISISEGLIRSLDPSFDMITKSWPYIIQYSNSDLLTATAAVAGDNIKKDVDKKIGESVKEVENVIEKGKVVVDESVKEVENVIKEVEVVVHEKTDEVIDTIDTLRRRATGTMKTEMWEQIKNGESSKTK